MIYFTSDLHFGHGNILKYCNRPFENTQEMDQELIENWNNRVKERDEVYILGDVTMHGSDFAMEKLRQLKGGLYLVKGNHDWFAEKKNFDTSLFQWVKDYHELNYQGERFILFHYPLVSWNHLFHGSYQLHGHQHNKADYNLANKYQGIRRFDVGVDANDYMPVSIDEIIQFFRESEQGEQILQQKSKEELQE